MSYDNKLRNYFPSSGARSTLKLSNKIKSNFEKYKIALLMLSKLSIDKKKSDYLNILQDAKRKLTELEIARAKKEVNKIIERDL